VSMALLNAYAGLGNPNQPRHVFAFFGASGVGKTATAKALAEFMFSSADALIRLDMSEYKEPHTISRLLGAPPGYIGYDDEGTFATRLRRQPYSIVLLDEIEKAHPQVHDAFLQVFDEGRFTDARGRKIDARHAIFILTSNLFTMTEIDSRAEYELHAASLRQSLGTFLRPEFVNRINEIVLFGELRPEDLMAIARLEIENLNLRLSKYQVTVSPTQEALEWITNEAYDPNSGARAVIRTVSKHLAEPISSGLVGGTLAGPIALEVVVAENGLSLRRTETR
jgi:ATP-dependent Clp protease ATP-binding subunit ClpA